MNLQEMIAKKKAAALAAEAASSSTSQAVSDAVVKSVDAPSVNVSQATLVTPGAEEAGKATVAQTSAASASPLTQQPKVETSSQQSNTLNSTSSDSASQQNTATTLSTTEQSGQTSAQPSVSPSTATSKPLSFAEKIAAQKRAKEMQTSGSGTSATATTESSTQAVSPLASDNSQSSSPVLDSEVADDEQKVEKNALSVIANDPQKASPANPLSNIMVSAASALLKADIDITHVPADTKQEIKEGYVGIAQKIRALTAASEDNDLKNAMSSLKAAIQQNPAACELLLPEEVGAMVIALRKIVGESVAVAEKKAPKEKKAAKEKAASPLTQEQLDAAWDEL